MVAKVIRNAQWQLAEHLKRCVMAVPADVGKPTRKAVGVRVKEYSLLTAF